MPNNIWYHADDYGVSTSQSDRILECHRNGVLNSISVIPNVNDISSPLEKLREVDSDNTNIRRILHLNFVEGKPVSNMSEVNLLVDRKGYFNKSFIDIFKWNYTLHGKKRIKLKNQLKTEIASQLRMITRDTNYDITGIDSHQHYHMIPIVFDAIMEVIDMDEFKDIDIRYVRMPVDPLKPLLDCKGNVEKVPMINWVKWMILHLYLGRNTRILKKRGIQSPVFFGIFYTCEMKYGVVKELLDSYVSYAKKKNKDLELMFHPGNLASEYELLDPKSEELREFYLSDNRLLEAQCLRKLNGNC